MQEKRILPWDFDYRCFPVEVNSLLSRLYSDAHNVSSREDSIPRQLFNRPAYAANYALSRYNYSEFYSLLSVKSKYRKRLRGPLVWGITAFNHSHCIDIKTGEGIPELFDEIQLGCDFNFRLQSDSPDYFIIPLSLYANGDDNHAAVALMHKLGDGKKVLLEFYDSSTSSASERFLEYWGKIRSYISEKNPLEPTAQFPIKYDVVFVNEFIALKDSWQSFTDELSSEGTCAASCVFVVYTAIATDLPIASAVEELFRFARANRGKKNGMASYVICAMVDNFVHKMVAALRNFKSTPIETIRLFEPRVDTTSLSVRCTRVRKTLAALHRDIIETRTTGVIPNNAFGNVVKLLPRRATATPAQIGVHRV